MAQDDGLARLDQAWRPTSMAGRCPGSWPLVAPSNRAAERIPGLGWDGGSGTVWRTDPSTGLTGILFTHRQLTSPEPPPVFVDVWMAARAALA